MPVFSGFSVDELIESKLQDWPFFPLSCRLTNRMETLGLPVFPPFHAN